MHIAGLYMRTLHGLVSMQFCPKTLCLSYSGTPVRNYDEHFRHGPRARGHLIEISDGMFGWYDLLGQPLASMKMPLLSVPIVVDKVICQGRRSNECIFQKIMFLFIHCIN